MDHKRHYSGSKLVLFGALALLVMMGYECYGRFNTLIWTVKGVYNLCQHEGVDFMRAWTYFESGMFELAAYLAAGTVLGLFGIILHNKARAGYFFLLAVAAMVGWGVLKLGLYNWRAILQIQNLQLIPMLLIGLGSVINLVQFYRDLNARIRDEETVRRSRYTQAM